MIENKLYSIMRDLNKMKSHNNAMERCVEERLNSSLDDYRVEITNAYDYLMTRSNLKVAKNLNKVKFEQEEED